MGPVNVASGNVVQKELDLIRSILEVYLAQGKSVSLWRLPEQIEKNIIICSEVVRLDSDQLSLEESQPGFIVSPFDRAAGKLFLPAEIHLKVSNGEVLPQMGTTGSEFVPSTAKPRWHTTAAPRSSGASGDDHYQQLVSKCIEAIGNNLFEKVVPSRCQPFQLPEKFDLLEAFDRLCSRHPQALVTLISTPQTGTWMGASPEPLVQLKNRTIFKTTALAGTQVYQPGVELKTVLWNQKEIEEQALVSRYIINNCFKKLRIREYEEHGPRSFRAGNLLHLKTEFTVDMTAINFPQLGTVMLNLLHPTSAVCGMPMDAAFDFLQKQEGYDRELYTGYWGPVNIEDETNIYVNLRCMRTSDHEAILYAGAGVTSDSVPTLEWEETVNKMNTLKQVILA